MYRKILVPLDGSELAELVLNYSIELGVRINADLLFLMVCDTEEEEQMPVNRNYIENIAESVKEKIIELRPSGPDTEQVTVTGELRTGYPAEEILECAEENDVDLIIMSTHGYSGIRRWALGSTADKILKESTIPVLLARAGTIPDPDYSNLEQNRIMVLLDGSELAESALSHVEAICENRVASQNIGLLEVCEPPRMPSYYPPNVPALPDDYLRGAAEGQKSAVKKYLDGIAAKLRAKGFNVSTELLEGEAADEIIKYTANHTCDLIVMTTHGRSGLTRWVFGSVADRIITKGSSPILLIRPVKTE